MRREKIDAITQFSLRPPELRKIFDKVGDYFRWFKIEEKINKLIDVSKSDYIIFAENNFPYLINENNHIVFSAPHPSPLSAYRGFFGCKHFFKTNTYLAKKNIKPINW